MIPVAADAEQALAMIRSHPELYDLGGLGGWPYGLE